MRIGTNGQDRNGEIDCGHRGYGSSSETMSKGVNNGGEVNREKTSEGKAGTRFHDGHNMCDAQVWPW